MATSRRLAVAGNGATLRIDDKWRKCATYLLVEGRDPETAVLEKQLFASGFFVTVWGADKSSAAIYLVTAQHLLDKSEDDGPLFVRIRHGARLTSKHLRRSGPAIPRPM